MVLMKTAKEYVKEPKGYRPETEMSGISLRGGPGSMQRSREDDTTTTTTTMMMMICGEKLKLR